MKYLVNCEITSSELRREPHQNPRLAAARSRRKLKFDDWRKAAFAIRASEQGILQHGFAAAIHQKLVASDVESDPIGQSGLKMKAEVPSTLSVCVRCQARQSRAVDADRVRQPLMREEWVRDFFVGSHLRDRWGWNCHIDGTKQGRLESGL